MGTSQARRKSVPVGAAIPALTRWGLSCDADLVYRTIATFGAQSARSLARELRLPTRRVDGALEELRAGGAAVRVTNGGRSAQQAPVWVPRPPAEVVNILRSRRMLHRVEAPAAGGLSTAIQGVRELGAGVRYLASRDIARERLAELLALEQLEHLAMNPEQAFDAASARAAAPLDREILRRGVALRVIGLPPADQDMHVGAELLDQPRYAYREAPRVPMKLLVIDRRVALFPADPQDPERGYLEISQPGVVGALVMLFEHHWATAVDPREYAVQQIVLSERERLLINLLAQGHTDVSAAAELRISARSITNIMRSLMDRLNVENRFQLGLVLGAARVPDGRPPTPMETS